MSKFLKIDLLNVGGGLNTGLPPEHIKDHQQEVLENFYPYGSKLIRRSGVTALSSAAHTEAITSLFAYKQSTGVWTLLLGARSGMCKLAGTAIVQLPVLDGRTYADSPYPWVFYQYQDMAYATRVGVGTLKRITENYIVDAGIPAPATAPTLAAGAAGDIPAANFYGVYTHYVSQTANESNPSPASAVLAHPGAKKIDWSGITVSLTPGVDARRLYRTLPNQTGQYFYVGAIADNITTVFTGDNVLVQDLGSLASINHGLPPSNPKYGDVWQERLWLTDGVDIWFSQVARVECYGIFNIISVFPDDGHEVRGIRAFGDRLIIGKTNKVHYLTGTDVSNFALQTLSDRHGCFSFYSMQVAEGRIIWYGGDSFYISDGTNVEAIGGGVEMRAFLDRIPDEYKDRVVATVFPEHGWYLATCPLDDTEENQVVLVYNYRTGAWTTFTHAAMPGGYAPSFLGEFYDANFEHVLYSTFYDGHVYRYNYGRTDDGVAFTAKLLTKRYGYDMNGFRKGVRRCSILATTAGEDVTLQVYRDGTLVKTRTVSLYQSYAWKRYNLSSLGYLGNTIQIGIEYSGEADIEIEGLAVEVAAFMRAGAPV